MSSKPDVQAERRGQILDAAEKVFSRLGFNKARMDDIAAESSLSKGALYWYYKSKDAIIQALLDRIFDGEMGELEALLEAEGSASERLRIISQTAVKEIRLFEHRMPLGYEFITLAARHKVVRKTLRGYYQRMHDILSQIIQQGIDSGEFSRIDAGDAALTIMGTIEGIALFWFIDHDWVDWESLGETPMKIVLDGLSGREG
jgi:AcrR family transcriptional regulator